MPTSHETTRLGAHLETKGPNWLQIILGINIIPFVLIGGYFFCLRFPNSYNALVFGVPILIVAALLIIWQRSYSFRIYQNGVLNGGVPLTLEEIESFTYREQVNYRKVVFIAVRETVRTICIVPYAVTQKRKQTFSWSTLASEDPGVERFQQSLNNFICARYERQVKKSGQAVWAKGFAFVREGLQCHLDNGAPAVIPYRNLRVEVDDPAIDRHSLLMRDLSRNEVFAKLPGNLTNLDAIVQYFGNKCEVVNRREPWLSRRSTLVS